MKGAKTNITYTNVQYVWQFFLIMTFLLYMHFRLFYLFLFFLAVTSLKPVDGCLQQILGIPAEVSICPLVGKLLKIKREKLIMSSECIFSYYYCPRLLITYRSIQWLYWPPLGLGQTQIFPSLINKSSQKTVELWTKCRRKYQLNKAKRAESFSTWLHGNTEIGVLLLEWSGIVTSIFRKNLLVCCFEENFIFIS